MDFLTDSVSKRNDDRNDTDSRVSGEWSLLQDGATSGRDSGELSYIHHNGGNRSPNTFAMREISRTGNIQESSTRRECDLSPTATWSLVPQQTSNDVDQQFHSLPSNVSSNGLSDEYSYVPSLESTASTEDSDTEKLKNTFKSAWNNMKYGFTWTSKTTFKHDQPIYLLGYSYHCRHEEKELQKKARENGQAYLTSLDKFMSDFTSRIWFTYRRDFPPLPDSSLTTDIGWGCMLRSGQMMLAQALIVHLLGRDWRFKIHRTDVDFLHHRKIIQFFGDLPIPQCPFSIHKLVTTGKKMLNKLPGDWYGPASVAYVLKQALEEAAPNNPLLKNLCIYVARDCTVYIDDLIAMCQPPRFQFNLNLCETTAASKASTSDQAASSSSANEPPVFRPLVLLIPVRLGQSELNKIYLPCLKNMLANPFCLGIIGGKPRHSLYFVGWQDDKFIYLDPHFCQSVVDVSYNDFDTDTFHCSTPRKMVASKMDPSCTIGFYCRNREDLDQLIKSIKEDCVPPMQKFPHPMIVFHHGRAADYMTDSDSGSDTQRVVRIRRVDQFGRKLKCDDKDDFVYL